MKAATRNVAEFGGLSHVMPAIAPYSGDGLMTAIGLPLLCVFISEFLSLRGALKPTRCGRVGCSGNYSHAATCCGFTSECFSAPLIIPKMKNVRFEHARVGLYDATTHLVTLIGVYPKPFS